MAVSIDARVGQREIDAAREAGADIEGVTSMEGTPVADVEEQITFGGYPNQIGPNQIGQSFLSRKGLLNKEPSHVDVIDIINSLHPDFVANASPAELDYAISVVQGKVDYDVIETVTPAVGAMKTMTKDIKALNEELDRRIAEITLANEQKQQDIKRAHVSPWMARTRMPDPIAPSIDYAGIPTQPNVSFDRLSPGERQRMEDAVPAFTSPLSPEGALGGPSLPTINVEGNTFGKITDSGNVPWARDVPINTFEQWQALVENTNQAFDYRGGSAFDYEKTTKKDTKPLTADAIKKIYSKTAKQHLKDKYNIQKQLIEDAKKDKKEVERLKKAAKGTGWFSAESKAYHKANKAYNKAVTHDAYSKAYGAVIGVNPALKFGANLIGRNIGTLGKGLEDFFSKKGMYGKTSWSDIMDEVEESEVWREPFNKKGEVAPTHPREEVSGGFWGLMSFAKQNKKLFESLSGDELWALISDPDEFWRFYEDALNAQ